MDNNSSYLQDPDFNQSASALGNSAQRSFFDQLSPKSALLVGLVGGVMTLCTIGFIILLVLALRGDGLVEPVVKAVDTVAAPQPSARAQERTPEAPTGPVPSVTKTDHVRGDASAPLTWVEYSDFECPFCKQFHLTMLRMMEEYKGKVKWVYRHFPLSFHPNAQKMAEASECANELKGNNGFWAYADKLFERSGAGFSVTSYGEIAQELGFNKTKFQQCLDSGKYAALVQQNEAGGQQAGVNGTPGSFLISKDGQVRLISGAVPYESIKAALDAQLK